MSPDVLPEASGEYVDCDTVLHEFKSSDALEEAFSDAVLCARMLGDDAKHALWCYWRGESQA